MSQSSVSPMTQAKPAVRSSIYKLLSLVFRYPASELFEAYKEGYFLSELFDKMSALPHLNGLVNEETGMIGKLRKDMQGTTRRDFEVAFTRTFDVGTPAPPCPPYEGLYRQGVERTSVMVEVSEFYKHFGLSMCNEEGKRELPDNLSAELEFLHFLTFKEGQARAEDNQELLKGYILAQRDFLERHLTKWLPDFHARLQASAESPFFTELTRLTLCFAKSDLAYVNTLLKE